MPKGIFPEAFEFITTATEARSPKVNGVARRPRYVQLLHHVGLPRERTHAAAASANIADFGLVDHVGTNRPRMMQAEGCGFDCLRQIAYRHEVIVNHVFAPPGVPSPEVHVGLENVI